MPTCCRSHCLLAHGRQTRPGFRAPAGSASRLSLLLLLLATAPVLGQEPGTPEDPAPADELFDAIDVEVVNVDVWVTGPDGQPVLGLERDDFLVFRNGDPVEASHFYAVEDGRPPAPAAPDGAPADDGTSGPLVDLPRIGPEIAPEHQLWLTLVVDNFNIHPIHRRRIVPALRQFLGRTLRPGDRAMMVTYDRSLQVRQPFTDSAAQLYQQLDALEDEVGWVVVRQREQRETLKRIEKAGHPNTAMAYAQQYAEQQRAEVDATVESLQELVDSMAGLPGRKALLWVSSGVPMLAGEEMFHAVAAKFDPSRALAEISRHDTTRAFERLARHANSHRVVFHSLDAAGLRGMTFGAAEYTEFLTPGLRSTLDSVVVENLHSPLRLVAEQTGGRAILGRNEPLEPLLEVGTDLRSFYSLGLDSSDADAGRYHRLEVKLREKRPGVTLRHRQGYRSKSQDSRMTELLRSAILYAHESNPLEISARWGEPTPQDGEETYLLPVQLRIPLAHLALLPITAEQHELRLKLFVGVADERGNLSEIDRSPLGLRLANEHVEAARGEAFLHTHQLLLSQGRKKIGLAVVDEFGRQSAILTRYIDVGGS